MEHILISTNVTPEHAFDFCLNQQFPKAAHYQMIVRLIEFTSNMTSLDEILTNSYNYKFQQK